MKKNRVLFPICILICILAVCIIDWIYLSSRHDKTEETVYYNNGAVSGEEDVSWQLVWSDEFDGDALNTDIWTYEVGSGKWGNEELEYYTEGDNCQVEDGNLIITAQYNPDSEENSDGEEMIYTSTRIKTLGNISFEYGKIEARIKLPSGKGIWPAFWMMGTSNDYQWPQCGEIDIFEAANACDICFGTIHWGYRDETSEQTDEYQEMSAGSQIQIENSDDWHVYGIEWSDTEIRWLLDDTVYYTYQFDEQDSTYDVFDEPFYLLLNVAVGGTWTGDPDPSIFPQSMYVDYVRVYTCFLQPQNAESCRVKM